MILFSILFFMAIYAAISIAFLVFVRSRTERPLYALLAVILIVLVPTWDMVLGAIVYFPSSLLVPKVAVYEKVETDGIYYEGKHDYVWELEDNGRNEPVSERTVVGYIDDVFRRGYAYAESRVTERGTYRHRRSISPVFYHCVPLPRDPDRPAYQRTSCVVVDGPKSLCTVREAGLSLGTASISTKKIYNRSTGKLMAIYRQVCMRYVFPFFAWLDWHGSVAGATCRPALGSDGQTCFGYTELEYHVLKPNK
ncbi:MAG: hypothetical protein PHC90_14105 [Syntrophorhabdaceae bacterium]|nr:hypothetical protein [Syntrophorhabdaceae bacterium]